MLAKMRVARGICLLLGFAALARAADTRYVAGAVHREDDAAVGRAEVRIDGAGSQVTTDSGEFRFPLAPPLQVGFPATFRVPGYVVVDPCVQAPGRTYLPAPEAATAGVLELVVFPRGDPKLKTGRVLRCIISEQESQFESKGQPAKGRKPRAALPAQGVPAFAAGLPYVMSRPAGPPWLVASAYHPQAPVGFAAPQQPRSGGRMQSPAEELGMSEEELAAAIDQWAVSASGPYDRGLAALHQRNYSEASRYLQEAITAEPATALEKYVLLARAEYELGSYAASESHLRAVLALHPNDPLLLNNLALVLAEAGKPAQAEPLYQDALRLYQSILGPEHPNLATVLNNMALLSVTEGRYLQAEPLYRRALAIDEKTSPDGPEIMRDLGNLAKLLVTQGRYAEAEPLLARVWEIGEKVLESSDPRLALGLNDLAELYLAQGRYAEAGPLLRRAQEIDEAVPEPGDPRLATTLGNLAQLDRSLGKYAEAEPLYRRALAMDRTVLGLSHPRVAVDLNNLGELYHDMGRDKDAEQKYREALAIDEKASPKNHPRLARNFSNLAEIYVDAGRYPEAERLLKRALAINEQALGKEHPEVALDLNDLADLESRRDNYEQSERLYKRALAINRKRLGSESPQAAVNSIGLARLCAARGDYIQAEHLYQSALAMNEKALGLKHPTVAADLNYLGDLYLALNNYPEAERSYQRALEIHKTALGADDPEVAVDLRHLGETYYSQGKYQDAQPVYQRALDIDEKTGTRSGPLARDLTGLAGAYYHQERYREAEPLYRRALESEKALGNDSLDAAGIERGLAAVLIKLGRLKEARAFVRRAKKLNTRTCGNKMKRSVERTFIAMPTKTQLQQNASPMVYAVCALIGLLLGIGLLFFYVYQAPKMVRNGAQNQVFYILLLPWALSCAAFLFGAMRSFALFTHKRLGNALELGGPVVLFCLVVIGGFKLVPAAPGSFDLTVRPQGQDNAMITTGKITIDLDNTRRSEDIASNGEANFKGIPAKFTGSMVRMLPHVKGYKEEWQRQTVTGGTLDLLLEKAPIRLAGTIIPPPKNWGRLRVLIEGQPDEAKVDELGRFDIPVAKAGDNQVRLRIYDGQRLVYDDNQSPSGPVTLKLHP